MIGRKGLTQGAGVIGFHILIGHLLDTLITGFVFAPGALGQIIHILFLGVKGDLNLIDDFLKILVELGVQHRADIFQGKAFFNGRFADPDPGDIALADMHDALNVIDQMMDLTLDDRLKIRLKFTPGDLDINAQRHGLALFNLGNVRADNLDLAVIDFIHLGHLDQLGALGLAAAHLGIQIGTAHTLAFIGRSKRAGNLDRRYADFQPADFNRFLDHFLVGHVGHHVLIGTDTGGQNFGNIGIGQGRKTPVDTACGRAGPIGSDLAQGIHKGKDAVLVIQQHGFVIARLDVTKGHGRPVGKTQGKNGR